MKIQSTPAEISTDSGNSEFFNTSPASPSADLIFNLLMQMMNTPLPEANKLTDALLQSEIDLPSVPNSDENKQFLFQQLNLDPTSTIDEMKSDYLISNVLNPDKKNNLSSGDQLSNPLPAIKKIDNPLDESLIEQTVSSSQKMKDLNAPMMINTSFLDSEISASVNVEPVLKDVIQYKEVNVDTKELKLNLPEEISSLKRELRPLPQVPIDVTSTEKVLPEISNINKSTMNTELPSTIQYNNFFSELSHFINSKTTQIDSKNTTVSNLVQMPKPAPQIADNIKIDLTSTLIDSVEKEAYTAKIRIYPPELGSVMAKLHLEKNVASLVLVTESHHVKQIVEANLPALRQHFQNSDIQLADIQVRHDQTMGERNQNEHPAQEKSAYMAENDPVRSKNNQKEIKNKPDLGNKMIDTYA